MKSALVVLATVATFATGFGSSHLADAVHGRESVSSSELTRLAACDLAVKHAATYDVAVQTGRDVETPLHAYWAAKDACGATVTLRAAR